MKKILILSVLFFCTTGFALLRSPNPSNATDNCTKRCDTVAARCNARCNAPHATSQQKAACHDKCAKMASACYKKCSIHVDHCAKEYAHCIKNAHSAAQKQSCRQGYHKCKGTN